MSADQYAFSGEGMSQEALREKLLGNLGTLFAPTEDGMGWGGGVEPVTCILDGRDTDLMVLAGIATFTSAMPHRRYVVLHAVETADRDMYYAIGEHAIGSQKEVSWVHVLPQSVEEPRYWGRDLYVLGLLSITRLDKTLTAILAHGHYSRGSS